MIQYNFGKEKNVKGSITNSDEKNRNRFVSRGSASVAEDLKQYKIEDKRWISTFTG